MITPEAVGGPLRSIARPPGALGLRAVAPAALAAVLVAGCGHSASSGRDAAYRPVAREITITTVPLLVKESQTLYPFLKTDFAAGGVLEGKEVYAFEPNTITVVEGDTVRFTFVNPEDDLHTFVLPDLAVSLPGQGVTHRSYIARHAGIYPIRCNVPSHQPMMSGQLVVLAPSAVGGGTAR